MTPIISNNPDDPRNLYIDLVEKSVANSIYPDSELWEQLKNRYSMGFIIRILFKFFPLFFHRPIVEPKLLQEGKGFPINALSMIGTKRKKIQPKSLEICQLIRIINLMTM